jgi:uncharacterized membrane protein (DUF2068 family)
MNQEKQRHGCLTAWLLLVIAASSLTAIFYLFAQGAIAKNLPSGTRWVVPTMTVMGILNVVFAVALFRWKKWGFFGLVTTGLVGLVINLAAGLNAASALGSLLGLVILFALLQIGSERKGWTQLE